jgi:hypothetical protein
MIGRPESSLVEDMLRAFRDLADLLKPIADAIPEVAKP